MMPNEAYIPDVKHERQEPESLLKSQLDCFGKSKLYFYTVIINIFTPHIQFKFYFLQFKP